MRRYRWFPLLCAVGVFTFGLALSLGLTNWHAGQNAMIARQALDVAGGVLAEGLRQRIANFNHALFGLRGALAVGDDRAASYRAFDRVVELDRRYPGALAFGYAERVSPAQTSALLDQVSIRQGRRAELLSVAVNNGDRFIVVEASGDIATGTDLASLPPVREAGMRATWKNEAVLSPPVFGSPDAPPGFYLLLPVYRHGTAAETTMQRHEDAVGWLFIHLSGQHLMHGIADQNLDLRLLDQDGEDDPMVIFDSAQGPLGERSTPPGSAPEAALQREFDQQFGGRSWHFLVTPKPAFLAALGQLPPAITLGAGCLISALAAWLAWSLIGLQRRALELAEKMTSALRASERKQRAILENASIGIMFSSERKVLLCNQKAAELFAWESPEAMLDLPGAVFWPSEKDYAEVGITAGTILSTGEVFDAERPMRRQDGSLFLARIKAKALDARSPAQGTIWIIEDVTAQRLLEEKLRDSERYLGQILGGSPIAIFVIDRAGLVTHWNKACEKLTGLSACEVIGQRTAWRGFYAEERPTLADLIVQGESEATVARYYGSRFSYSALIPGAIEAEHFFPDMPGAGRWLHFIAAPLVDSAGDVIGAVETLIDISARHEAELALEQRSRALQNANAELATAMERLTATRDELVRSEKLAALGAMVAGVAHELNTPLGNCLMLASALNEKCESFREDLARGLRRSMLDQFIEETNSASQLLLKSLTRAGDLVRSFKRVAVNQANSVRREFELGELIAQVLTVARSGLGNDRYVITGDIPPELTMNSFPGELEQIVISLLSNSIMHGFEGRERGTVSITARAQDDKVVIAVSDDGKGIDSASLPRVFDPFFTSKFGRGGNGLGLNIAYNQTTGILGGRIDVTSTEGAGTWVTLILPLCAPGKDGSPINSLTKQQHDGRPYAE